MPAVGEFRTHVLLVEVDANAGRRIEVQDLVVLVVGADFFADADVAAALLQLLAVRLLRLLRQLEHGLVLGLPLVDAGLRLARLDVVAVFVAAVGRAAAASVAAVLHQVLVDCCKEK